MAAIKQQALMGFTLLTLLLFFVAMIMAMGDNSHAERTSEQASKYNISVNTYDRISCMNGWVIVGRGHHDWLYARDENFDPIRCDE